LLETALTDHVRIIIGIAFRLLREGSQASECTVAVGFETRPYESAPIFRLKYYLFNELWYLPPGSRIRSGMERRKSLPGLLEGSSASKGSSLYSLL
jgi:hypothetical protein